MKNNILVISDESYEEIIYEDHLHTCAAEFDHENVIIISSFSKSFCMTGFRVGYVIAPNDLAKNILLVHQHNTASASTPANTPIKISHSMFPSIILNYNK